MEIIACPAPARKRYPPFRSAFGNGVERAARFSALRYIFRRDGHNDTKPLANGGRKGVFGSMLDRISLILSIIGGINWLLVGLFRLDLVAYLFGGQAATVSRIIYTVVGIAALWCISLLFREREVVRETVNRA